MKQSAKDGDNVKGFMMRKGPNALTRHDGVAKYFVKSDSAVIVFRCKKCSGDVVNNMCRACGNKSK